MSFGTLLLQVFLQVLLHQCVLTTSFNNNTTLCLYSGNNSCQATECNVTSTDYRINATRSNGSLVIKICSKEYRLYGSIAVDNKHAVTLKGLPSTLTCSGPNIGLHFNEIKGLVLQDVHIVSCGAIYTVPTFTLPINNPVKFKSSVYITNSTDVTLERLTIANSQGTGISMINNNGTVEVHDCSFQGNQDSSVENDIKSGGSGLHIVLSYCGPRSLRSTHKCLSGLGRDVVGSHYRIHNCTFVQNSAGQDLSDNEDSESHKTEVLEEGYGRGGGLCVVIDKNSSLNVVEILNCNFTENSGKWGGGLYIAIMAESWSNIVEIKSTIFRNNTSNLHAGGGVDLGYQVYHNNYPQNNTMLFQNCTFVNNRALFGGGVSFYSSVSRHLPNHMLFKNCNWTGNEAAIGSALNISPQVWKAYIYDPNTEIVLSDLIFASNRLTDDLNTQKYVSYKKGRGAFLAVGYRILFRGSLIFESNTDSAMYLTSTQIELAEYSSMNFTDNRGFEGGAIYMLGFSTIVLNDNSKFLFSSNTALDAGGAIYQYSYDKRDFFTSRSCFIRYHGNRNLTERNITFLFENNKAGVGRNSTEPGKYGHSIYATTISPCYNSHGCMPESYSDTFNCIANFVFEDENDYDISTSGKETTINTEATDEHNITWAIAGKLFELPIRTLNDLSKEVSADYHASVQCLNNCSVQIDSLFAYLSNKLIRFFGKPGDKAILTLENISTKRELVLRMQVNIQQCPPGFMHNRDKMQCECSAQTNYRFPGIRTCDNENFVALLISGYWVGYDQTDLTSNNETIFSTNKSFLYGYCPRGQCSDENSKQQELPQNTSLRALDAIICGETRTGVLCSKCREGYASNYHDDTNRCKRVRHNCRWSWLLYLVSEIVPVTVFFVVVMLFNIKFTDGAINGFILFFQISDTMLIRGNGFIKFPAHANFGLEVYRFITRIYNLNFFATDSLSFCLWKTADTLDLLAFKYITIFYASTLVLVIIIIFRYCLNRKMNNLLVKLKPGSAASTRSTIIHGISGFLVICYSECTRVSLLLLTPAMLYTRGEERNHVKRIVPFYNGELGFFNGKHLLYALPALLIVTVLGVIPPLLLISYPLCYRVFSVLRLSESKITKILCTCIPLEKLKPFFDSFQRSYKDEYRFFSGLYFLYRFTTLATFAFMSHLATFYALVQVQFAIILTVHALCQPYKKRWHNVVDALLFMNLSAVNAITLFNYHLTQNLTDEQQHINVMSTVQVILLYLPLIYITAFATKKLLSKTRQRVAYLVQAYKQKRKRVTSSEISPRHELSASFSLNAAEYRLLDNIKY